MINLASKSSLIKSIYHKLPIQNWLFARKYNYYKNLNPEDYPKELSKWYLSATGTTLNLENPQTFDEKIQWLKLYDSTPLKTRLADKYLVRQWVADNIGEEYLIPILGVWDSFDEIDFDKLPNQFVLKANHGSGWNVIVRDKSTFNKTDAKKKFDKWMKTNLAYYALELHYKDIVPKIIAERYLENNGGNLSDYKVHCFNGKATYIQYIGGDRATHEAKEGWFDREWNLMSFGGGNYPLYDISISKPFNLDKLLKLSEKLSESFSYVRVDFYVLNDSSFKFGEMTFTPASGVHNWCSYGIETPNDVNLKLGQLIQLHI